MQSEIRSAKARKEQGEMRKAQHEQGNEIRKGWVGDYPAADDCDVHRDRAHVRNAQSVLGEERPHGHAREGGQPHRQAGRPLGSASVAVSTRCVDVEVGFRSRGPHIL